MTNLTALLAQLAVSALVLIPRRQPNGKAPPVVMMVNAGL